MMRILVISAALLVTSIANAATPIDGWYTGVFGGFTYLPGNIDNTNLGLTRSFDTYHWGYDVGGNLGFKCNSMRYEAELTYLEADLKNFNINGISQTEPTGYNQAGLALANAYYDFPGLTMSIQPFLGVGIGYGWIKSALFSTGPVETTSFSVSNSVFAYQATGGLTYNFAENYAVGVGYRYIGTTHVADLGNMFQAHLGNLSVTYRLDGNNYK